MKPVRVVLIEDNDVFRDALELLFDLEEDVTLVASVGDGTEAVPACVEYDPDVVVMDFRLPGIDGVQATAAVRLACPGARVVCLTGAADEREVEALYEAGAVACLRKDQELEEIVAAIQRAAGRLAA